MSPRDRKLTVKLTDTEYTKLEAAAEAAGFLTVSEYVRYMTIGEGRSIQSDLKAILEKLQEK